MEILRQDANTQDISDLVIDEYRHIHVDHQTLDDRAKGKTAGVVAKPTEVVDLLTS